MINNGKNSFDDTISFIPKERKLEIDEILKRTEKDMDSRSLETVSFEEFRDIIFGKGRMFSDGIDI